MCEERIHTQLGHGTGVEEMVRNLDRCTVRTHIWCDRRQCSLPSLCIDYDLHLMFVHGVH